MTSGEARSPLSLITGRSACPTSILLASYIAQFHGPSITIAAFDEMNCVFIDSIPVPVATTPCSFSKEIIQSIAAAEPFESRVGFPCTSNR